MYKLSHIFTHLSSRYELYYFSSTNVVTLNNASDYRTISDCQVMDDQTNGLLDYRAKG